MRSDAWVKAALGVTATCACGGMAGIGLANYVTSGSFDFYRQQHVAEWRPQASRPMPVETGDLALVSDYRSGGATDAPGPDFAAFTD